MAQNVKTVNGLAIASVKTWNGLAIASAKTILGVDNTAGGAAYPNVQLPPTADGTIGDDYTTAPLWSTLDDHPDTTTYVAVSVQSDTANKTAIILCDSSGNTGEITAIDVNIQFKDSTAKNLSISVSTDGSTWEPNVTQTVPTTTTIQTYGFTGLSYTDPATIHVRFQHEADSSYDEFYPHSFELDINP